ncbi:hypothetical protein ACFR99_06125 [Haloarchaeobius amylolyticus]|uniref:Uncharacterized protein n=1 Tax=Haloarchaeobius amylolyticus TaxID=1198296 RepID=A0ABD6BEF9_9EURY
MFDALLHTGTEHPNLMPIVVASFLTFVAGLGAAYSERVREFVRTLSSSSE